VVQKEGVRFTSRLRVQILVQNGKGQLYRTVSLRTARTANDSGPAGQNRLAHILRILDTTSHQDIPLMHFITPICISSQPLSASNRDSPMFTCLTGGSACRSGTTLTARARLSPWRCMRGQVTRFASLSKTSSSRPTLNCSVVRIYSRSTG